MDKTFLYNKIEKTLCVCYPFDDVHAKTLLTIYENGRECEFENRDPNLFEDIDGNEISWKICDDLLEMGLLEEDEESFDVFYELTNEGLEIVFDIMQK